MNDLVRRFRNWMLNKRQPKLPTDYHVVGIEKSYNEEPKYTVKTQLGEKYVIDKWHPDYEQVQFRYHNPPKNLRPLPKTQFPLPNNSSNIK